MLFFSWGPSFLFGVCVRSLFFGRMPDSSVISTAGVPRPYFHGNQHAPVRGDVTRAQRNMENRFSQWSKNDPVYRGGGQPFP